MREAPFVAPTLRIPESLAIRIINEDPDVMKALAHYVRTYVVETLAVHNPYNDPGVEGALIALKARVGTWPSPTVQDLALLMVDLEARKHAPATPEQIARINDRSTWTICPCNPLYKHACSHPEADK